MNIPRMARKADLRAVLTAASSGDAETAPASDLHIVAQETWAYEQRGRYRVHLRGGTAEHYVEALRFVDPTRGWTLEMWEESRKRVVADLAEHGWAASDYSDCYLGLFVSPSKMARDLTRVLGVPVRVDTVSRLA